MPKRISDLDRITTYFVTADSAEAQAALSVVNSIMNARASKGEVVVAAKAPRKPRKAKQQKLPSSEEPNF
jgi:hypothetical protein